MIDRYSDTSTILTEGFTGFHTIDQMLAHRLLLASVLVSPVVDAFSTLPQASPFRKVSATALRAEKSSLKNDVLATLAAVGIWAASSGANAEVIRTMDFR